MSGQSKIEEIYAAVLPEIAKHGYEDTTENRLYALQGLRDAWKEIDVDEDEQFEKALYGIALSAEIFGLQMQLRYPNVKA